MYVRNFIQHGESFVLVTHSTALPVYLALKWCISALIVKFDDREVIVGSMTVVHCYGEISPLMLMYMLLDTHLSINSCLNK